MNQVELILEIDDNSSFEAIRVFAVGILDRMKAENWQMGLVITDNEGIRSYNSQWRDKDVPTDVLTFVQDEGVPIPVFPGAPIEAGDVIVSLEKVRQNAREWNNPYDEELRRVVIHGILHLHGMDHPGDDYSDGMLKLQEEILKNTDKLMKDGE